MGENGKNNGSKSNGNGKLSHELKTFKNSIQNSYRFTYEYRSPVVKAENIIIFDPAKEERPSNGKVPVYKLLKATTG